MICPRVSRLIPVGPYGARNSEAHAGEAGGAGSSIALPLYWQAIRDLERDFTVFVHLLDGANRVVSQQDNQPALGA